VAAWPELSLLALGTAAFGMPYGIANPPEIPSPEGVEIMLDRAFAAGISTFDTAAAYGESEQRLGAWIKRRGISPHLATKLPALAGTPDAAIAGIVDTAIAGSTARLGLPPATYLAHDAADYLQPAVREHLHEAVARGMIGAAGVSVYAAKEVLDAIAAGPPAAIQLPINVFDQRMIESGALAACAAAGITVFARSVFLQGVLLMDATKIPDRLAALRPAIAAFEALCAAEETSRVSFALRYVRDLPSVSSTIVGAYTSDQLATLTAAAQEPPLSEAQRAAIAAIAKGLPEALVDPRNWPARR
jgi:aryl-alcohol dehydrogenase-like predicted oxidoreductase